MQASKCSMREILTRTPVMPVLTVHDASEAGDLARAFVDGGIYVFEVLDAYAGCSGCHPGDG